MKQLINLGSAVDAGDGDYLHKGASKINDTFDDIYYELGDGDEVYSAGSFKTIDLDDTKGGIYFPRFGQSLDINTTKGSIKVNLPEGTPDDFGKIIILRDIWGSWLTQPVEVKPGTGATIKGISGYTQLQRNYSVIKLVFMPSYRWEYVTTVQVDKHRSEDLRSVVMNEFIAVEGQSDFPEPFGVDKYNPTGLEVYRRGNKLYYGKEFSDNSEYGSIGLNGELVPLDGITIKLRHPCVEGDTVQFTSYIDGIETFRTSYKEKTRIIKNMDIDNGSDLPKNALKVYGTDYVEDTYDNVKYLPVSLSDLGIESYDSFNPYAYQVKLNGVQLTRMEDVGGSYFCQGVSSEITSPELCRIEGGEWLPESRTGDFSLVFDGSKVSGIEFNTIFEQDDILQISWYNNIIGATVTIDEIRTELESSFISTVDEFHISNSISIKDLEETEGLPTQENVVYDHEEKLIRPHTVHQIMDLMMGIGFVYMNYYNKESPELIMGFGKWRRLESTVVAGFSDDYSNVNYGQNNTFLDSAGNPTPTPGGVIGRETVKLTKDNIPLLDVEDGVLVKDIVNGNINIGACMVDPDDETTNDNMKYSEKKLVVGVEDSQIENVSVLQPTTVISMWVRVA